VKPDGSLIIEKPEAASTNSEDTPFVDALETVFTEGNCGKYVPRAIFVDLEPTCIGKQIT